MPSPHAQTANAGSAYASRSAAWRNTLKAGRAELQRAYLAKPNASLLLRNHSRLIDRILKSLWRELGLPSSIALVAVGGYGRSQQFPYSDVDLLLLLSAREDEALNEKLTQLIGLLWDIGLEVGHSVRTVEECKEEAAKDVTVQTNLLEARLLAGSSALFREFTDTIYSQLDSRTFFEAKLLEQQQRHLRFHDTAYNLEPNLKDSPGGLRDLQNILWIGRPIGLGNWKEQVRGSIISAEEAEQIRRHELFLQNLRIRLQYLANRREDRILFDFQGALAQQMGIGAGQALRQGGKVAAENWASEQLMQQYYRTAKFVTLMNEILLQSLRTKIFPPAAVAPAAINPRFQASSGMLEAQDDGLFRREPGAMLECFLLLAQHPELKGIGAATLRALWLAGKLINHSFRQDPRNRALFMEIFRQPRGLTHVLRRMHRYGVLGRYVPAFGRIVGQMQHDLFHVYTVDEHILFVIRNLRRFTVPEFAHEYPLCSRLISSFERPEVLYLAGLFHDIAKGSGGDHSLRGSVAARAFCHLHGLYEEDAAMVAWLVENHLLMSMTAQKRDLSDPGVVAAFAQKVGDRRHLAALYLLTVADIRGTSPKVWNAWKGKLLESLFLSAERHLSGGSPVLPLQARQVEALSIMQQYALSPQAQEQLWAQLDEGYFLRHEAQEIAWHARLLSPHVNTKTPVVRARLSPHGEGIQVLIYTPDQDDLFARICSFFEHLNYNIVEAKVCTTRHGYALDSFLVLDEGTKGIHYRDVLSYIEYELSRKLLQREEPEAPLQGRLSRHLKYFPIAPEVSLSPDEKGTYHVLSVIAGDRPGLLSRIAQVFLKHHIHLHTAKIATLGERAEDTFLITADDNRLNDTKAVLRLERDLLQQLAPA